MLFFVAKLVNPGLLGMRIRTKKIKIIFTNNQITFNIFFPNVFFDQISKISLKTFETFSPESIDSNGSFLNR